MPLSIALSECVLHSLRAPSVDSDFVPIIELSIRLIVLPATEIEPTKSESEI